MAAESPTSVRLSYRPDDYGDTEFGAFYVDNRVPMNYPLFLQNDQRVIGKAEHLAKGENPRFVVTTLSTEGRDARSLYEDLKILLEIPCGPD